MNRAVARAVLHQALDAAAGLPPADIEQVKVLIDVGELKVALETLCTQIYEYDIEVDQSQRARLERLGSALGVAAAHLLGDPWAEQPTADDA